MREIPEALVQAAQLNDILRGNTITEARTGESEHKFTWYNEACADPNALLSGKTFTEAVARGGILEMRFEEARVALCDGASPRFWQSLSQAPAKRQLYIAFSNGSALTATTAMYGGVWIFGAEGFDNAHYIAGCQAVSPLSDAFDESHFLALREGLPGKTSMKAFLATEQRIPGLGNGVLQDILFRASLHPKRRLDAMDDEAFHRLYLCVKDVLREMTEKGGRDVEKDALGKEGGYKTILSRLTLGKPCPVCETAIEKTAYLGGAVYFCPECQKTQ